MPIAKPQNNKQKGNLLEDIVASLHREPGVVVQTRVKVRALNSTNYREIDVLLTAKIAGFEVRVAISCKNERKKLQITDVDVFSQTLQEVGIALQQSVIVCTGGATKDAIKSAKAKGIKIYLYKGLGDDGLSEKIEEAVHSQLFCLLVGRQIAFFYHLPDNSSLPPDSIELTMDTPEGDRNLAILECLYQSWLDSRIPASLGRKQIFVSPSTEGEKWRAIVDVEVVGFVGRLAGTVKKRALLDLDDSSLRKLNLIAQFERNGQRLNLAMVESENEISDSSNKVGWRLVNRIKVPRVSWNNLYWPITKTEYDKLVEARRTGKPICLDDDYISDLSNGWLAKEQ